jgi:hypothetical protein
MGPIPSRAAPRRSPTSCSSRPTPRDHLKAVCANASVASRGELAAQMFADFYEPQQAADVARVVRSDDV